MQTKDMRNEHDLICSWYSTRILRSRSLLKVRTKWTVRYACFAHDVLQRNGLGPTACCPTRETLQRLGLEDIAADLQHTIYCLRKEWVR